MGQPLERYLQSNFKGNKWRLLLTGVFQSWTFVKTLSWFKSKQSNGCPSSRWFSLVITPVFALSITYRKQNLPAIPVRLRWLRDCDHARFWSESPPQTWEQIKNLQVFPFELRITVPNNKITKHKRLKPTESYTCLLLFLVRSLRSGSKNHFLKLNFFFFFFKC